MAATPYSAALRKRKPETQQVEKVQEQQQQSATAKSANASMSSTAKRILDTLEKMSTPVKDAQRIPLSNSSNGAEKEFGQTWSERRRKLAEELLNGGSLLTPLSRNRKRPNLRGDGTGQRNLLSGPPLRNTYSASAASSTSSASYKTRPEVSKRLNYLAQRHKEEQERKRTEERNSLENRGKGGGKIKSKNVETEERNSAQNKVDDSYLNRAAENPFLGMKTLPKFDLPSTSKSSAEVVAKVFNTAETETPKARPKAPKSPPKISLSRSFSGKKPEFKGETIEDVIEDDHEEQAEAENHEEEEDDEEDSSVLLTSDDEDEDDDESDEDEEEEQENDKTPPMTKTETFQFRVPQPVTAQISDRKLIGVDLTSKFDFSEPQSILEDSKAEKLPALVKPSTAQTEMFTFSSPLSASTLNGIPKQSK